jgi:hypothetical protein
MADDPKAARETVEIDIRLAAQGLRESNLPTQFVSFEDPDRSKWPEGDGDRTLIPVTIGIRSDLSKAAAAHCAAMWQEVTARYPKAFFLLNILGYDTDPRELWEFPEVRRYVRRWARLTGLNDLETANRWIGSCEGRVESPLSPERYPIATGGPGFVAACGVFGEAIRQQALQQHKATVAN